MIVTADLAPGTDAAPADFADIAECTKVGWGPDGMLQVEFARDLTADEQARVRVRCMSTSSTEEQLRLAALNALANNRAFLNGPDALTTLQVVQQVKALTRQMQAVLRLAAGRFDGTD